MKLVFFGTPQFAIPCLQALLNQPEFEVVGVVTQPDKRRGRGTQTTPSPIKTLALQHQLPLWQPPRLKKDEETIDALGAIAADCFVVVAYGQILSPRLLALPRLGCINVHGSLLPAYRGAAPIQWCLYHGETETGVTTMLMDAGMDTGAMMLKATIPVPLLENAQTLAEKLSKLGADLLLETLKQWQTQTLTPTPQDSNLATYAPLIQKQDYVVDWSRSSLSLHNQVRGFFPNCTTTFRQQPLKMFATVPLGIPLPLPLPDPWAALAETWEPNREPPALPGTVIAVLKGFGPVVQTGEGALLITQVQPSGKRSQSGWDFANGTRLELGEVLGVG